MEICSKLLGRCGMKLYKMIVESCLFSKEVTYDKIILSEFNEYSSFGILLMRDKTFWELAI